ncbi:MAG: hypothetical protein HY423_16050 [Candidatus Lambdaproteobacteria bacterium]|nr:hypothetical protein [Candidatus Lambdaproteobacteria bacterium]
MAQTPTPGRVNRWLVLFTTMVGAFIAILDTAAVNAALPVIMTAFGADLEQAKWISPGGGARDRAVHSDRPVVFAEKHRILTATESWLKVSC